MLKQEIVEQRSGGIPGYSDMTWALELVFLVEWASFTNTVVAEWWLPLINSRAYCSSCIVLSPGLHPSYLSYKYHYSLNKVSFCFLFIILPIYHISTTILLTLVSAKIIQNFHLYVCLFISFLNNSKPCFIQSNTLGLSGSPVCDLYRSKTP